MGNIATNIDTQIETLRNRGMLILDNEKAKEHLLDIRYYRLGFYWHYFEIDDNHNFQEQIHFDDIIKLYYLDIDLKNVLSKYIYRIEVHFRTQVVYWVSNKYKTHPAWFNVDSIVDKSFIKDFNSIYTNLKMYNKALKKHHEKYTNDIYAPAWKTFEFLTFGQVFKFFCSLKDNDLKDEIANQYGFRDYTLLINFFKAIINIRNICSHNGVLFDFNQPIGIHRIPNKKYRFKTRNTTNLNASIRLILFILSKISKNRADELENNIKSIVTNASQNTSLNTIIRNHICLDI